MGEVMDEVIFSGRNGSAIEERIWRCVRYAAYTL